MKSDQLRPARRLTFIVLVVLSVAQSARGDALFVGQWNGAQGWISFFTTSGTIVDPTFAPPRPSNIGQTGLTASAGSLFAASYYAGEVSAFSIPGGAANDPLITGLSAPTGIASSGDRLFVLNNGSGTVAEYNTAGQLINGSLITGLADAWAIAVNGDDLYVASNASNSVSKYTTSGSLINPSLVTGLHGPQGIAVAGERLFVSNLLSGSIGEYTTAGDTVNASLIAGLSTPSNIVVSGDDLYVVNYGPTGSAVGHYTTSGATVNASLITGISLPGGLAIVDGVAIPANLAGADDDAYFTGARPDPGPGPPSTIAYESLDLAPGSTYTLGSNETLQLDNGAGTLTIQAGAVFNGNGLINGDVLNAGLVRIPITGVGNVSKVTGGIVQLVMPVPPAPGVPVVVDPPSLEPTVVNDGTIVIFSPADIGGGSGGGGGGGGTGITGQSIIWNGPGIEVSGTLGLDASLEVTGSYTQTETGALRLFVAGAVHEPGNELYSVLTVGEGVSLAGSLQIVLQPELFGYLPTLGDTFDVIRSPAGITLAPDLLLISLVTRDGSPYLAGLGISEFPFDSGFSNDPDHLNLLNPGVWQMSLVENDTILRVQFIGVPEPSSLLLAGLGMTLLVARGFRRRCMPTATLCRCAVCALVIAAMPQAESSASSIYDASADFDAANNPSTINGGAYSYGYTQTLGGTFSLLPGLFTNGPISGYNAGTPGSAPSLSKNLGGPPFDLSAGGSVIHYEAGQLVLHPGSLGEYAVLRFTAPLAGTYSYDATFNDADSVGATTDVHVLINGVGVDAAGINVNGGGETATLVSPVVLLAAGETIDFAVGRGNGSYFFDSTGLFATVALVPEPSAFALVVGGILTIAVAWVHVFRRCPPAARQR